MVKIIDLNMNVLIVFRYTTELLSRNYELTFELFLDMTFFR